MRSAYAGSYGADGESVPKSAPRQPDWSYWQGTQGYSLAGLSNDAKVLYALMLDRASISKVNGFLKTDGTIRIYFTLEQAQTKLHRSRQCATRIFHELEFSGLICRKKQGLGKPALITLNYPSNAKLIQPKKGSSILSG